MLSATVETIRAMERASIASGIPEYTLMHRAGCAAAAWIAAHFSDASRFVVLCGSGNNGGDAMVAAAELHKRFPVIIFSTKALSDFTGCAAIAAGKLPPEIPFTVCDELDSADLRPGDVIIDGLLGIGFAGGNLRRGIRNMIAAANDSRLPVIALDLPSGMEGNTGNISPQGAINAAVTLTFGRPKNGLFTTAGLSHRGILRVIDIGLQETGSGGINIMTNCDAVKMLSHFAPDCHKNSRGRVLIWGGSLEYPGAAALATLGAMRCGAGMVRTTSEGMLSLPRAAIFRHLAANETPEAWFPASDVLVCGCGWGQCATAENLQTAWRFHGVLLLDADALNALAHFPDMPRRQQPLLLTPHPGEAARLAAGAGISLPENRFNAAMLLAEKFNSITILKGKDSIIAAPGKDPVLIAAGSPALATAGSGDVLAGCIGALASRSGMTPFEAALLGTYIHGVAGENSCGTLIADDLPEQIGIILQKIGQNGLF